MASEDGPPIQYTIKGTVPSTATPDKPAAPELPPPAEAPTGNLPATIPSADPGSSGHGPEMLPTVEGQDVPPPKPAPPLRPRAMYQPANVFGFVRVGQVFRFVERRVLGPAGQYFSDMTHGGYTADVPSITQDEFEVQARKVAEQRIQDGGEDPDKVRHELREQFAEHAQQLKKENVQVRKEKQPIKEEGKKLLAESDFTPKPGSNPALYTGGKAAEQAAYDNGNSTIKETDGGDKLNKFVGRNPDLSWPEQKQLFRMASEKYAIKVAEYYKGVNDEAGNSAAVPVYIGDEQAGNIYRNVELPQIMKADVPVTENYINK
jgi:hypothetical protein